MMAGLCTHLEELRGELENISEIETGDNWWRQQWTESERTQLKTNGGPLLMQTSPKFTEREQHKQNNEN